MSLPVSRVAIGFIYAAISVLFTSTVGHSQQPSLRGAGNISVREGLARSLAAPIFTNPRATITDDALETLRVYNRIRFPVGSQVIRSTNEPCAFCVPMDPRGAEDALIRLIPFPTSDPMKVKACANSCHPQNPSLVSDYHQRSAKDQAGLPSLKDASQILASRLTNYLSSSDYTKCKHVFEKYSDNVIGWLSAVRDGDIGGLSAKGRAGLKEYVLACFHQMPSAPMDFELQRVADRVGQFSPPWREILGYTQDCHGIINDKKLLTALHCFLNDAPRIGQSVTVSIPQMMTFKTLAGAKLDLQLCDSCNASKVTWTNNGDVIEVPIVNWSSLAEVKSAEFQRARVQIGDQLLLFGYSPYEQLLSLGEGRAPFIMKDDSALCSAFDSQDKIVVHGCQTGPGTSGAPIFVRRSGDLAIAAVHTGATDALPVPMKRWSPTIANYGVLADAL